MKNIAGIVCILMLYTSCVTRSRYNALTTEIAGKQKSIAKLEWKLTRLQNTNSKLTDSATKLQ